MKKMLVIDDSLSVRESLRIIFQDTYRVRQQTPGRISIRCYVLRSLILSSWGLVAKRGTRLTCSRRLPRLIHSFP